MRRVTVSRSCAAVLLTVGVASGVAIGAQYPLTVRRNRSFDYRLSQSISARC